MRKNYASATFPARGNECGRAASLPRREVGIVSRRALLVSPVKFPVKWALVGGASSLWGLGICLVDYFAGVGLFCCTIWDFVLWLECLIVIQI